MTDEATATRLVDHLELLSIFMERTRTERGPGNPMDAPELRTNASVEHKYSSDDLLVYTVLLQWAVVDADDQAVLDAEASLALVFRIHGNYKPTDAEIASFAYGGVAFQAHPYLREHVSHASVAAGLPPMYLPLLVRPELTNYYQFVEAAGDDEPLFDDHES